MGGTRWVSQPLYPHLTLSALRIGRPGSDSPSFPSEQRKDKAWLALNFEESHFQMPNAFLLNASDFNFWVRTNKELRREHGQKTPWGGGQKTGWGVRKHSISMPLC